MNIKKLQFEDKSLEWHLEEMAFDKLTLLVGASGVGKTRILSALMGLKKVSDGGSLSGIAWSLDFETRDGQKYQWSGEFERKESSIFIFDISDDENRKNKPKIISEKLSRDGKLIVDRKINNIELGGQRIVRLSQQESILSLLKEEELVKPAHESMKQLHLSDHSNSVHVGSSMGLFNFFLNNKRSKKSETLQDIQESELETPMKLFLLSKSSYKKARATLNAIKQRFIAIFPQVEDIKIAPLDKEKEMPEFLRDYPFIQIKERDVHNWIIQPRISSGMFRTLMQLSELYLCAEGTVFLIDEFENSLGVNCIDEITNDILASGRQLQFILTSHHPYIINAIDFKYWKLITRKAGMIKAQNMDAFKLGKSKHSAFMQLLQLEEYQTGQEQI